MYKVRN